MIGDTSCRVLLQVLGYVYPAYLCFKDIEGSGKPERLKLWCMYWVIIAGFTAIQPFSDAFLFFIPFYYSLKLAFACYLWANNLQGTKNVYIEYVRPFVHRHEPVVDYKLSQMKVLVSNLVSSNVSKIVQYVQSLLIATLSQQVDKHGLRAEATGEAAPAAGYARSESFASAHSSGFFEKSRVHPIFASDTKDE